MKKKIKIILCVVVVLAVVVSVVATVGFGNNGNSSNKSAGNNSSTKKEVSSTNKNSKASSTTTSKTDLKNKNVADIKKTENGDSINVVITGKDTASYAELKEVALDTANDLKKQNPDKKINVKAELKNNEVEDVNFGNKSNENQIYFETKPMYNPILNSIIFKLHNLNNVSKVQVFLDGKETKLSDSQILKLKDDVFAVKGVGQNFKTGKIILQDKNGNKLESNF